jgi:hypothetical protein
MNEIKCPHCGQVFKVDESGFADIVKQIRNHEFEDELRKREELLKRENINAVKLVEANTKAELQKNIASKEAEIANLNAKLEAAFKAAETTKILAVTEAVSKLEKERDAFASELKNKETEKQLAVTEAVNKIEKERDTLAGELKSKDSETKLLEAALKEKHLAELKSKDEMIAYYKDMKAKLSTKMVGETLEQHCETQFNQIRATAFPKAYFEKDNDARSGSKGDYIYRETDEIGRASCRERVSKLV